MAPYLITCSLELQGEDKSYEDFARSYAAQAIFASFVVADVPAMPDSSRVQPIIQSIWGTGLPYEAAHIIPLARSCSSDWIDVFIPLVVAVTGQSLEELANVLLFGLYRRFNHRGNPVREWHSGLLHSLINFLGLPNQKFIYDDDPSVLLLPLLTVEEIMTWSGESYRCLIIAQDKKTMLSAGFSAAVDEGSEYFCDVDSSSEDVQSAFRVFTVYQRMMTLFLASKDLKDPATSKKSQLCQFFREFLRQYPKPMIPCFDPARLPQMLVVCLNFKGTPITLPGQSVHHGGQQARARSCPHPFLVILRSINAFYNMLHRLQLWPAWADRLAAARPELQQEALVLLPSCVDCSPREPDCLCCKAAVIRAAPQRYPGLSERTYEAAADVLYMVRVIDEEEARLILEARAGDDEEHGAESGPEQVAGDNAGDTAGEGGGGRRPSAVRDGSGSALGPTPLSSAATAVGGRPSLECPGR